MGARSGHRVAYDKFWGTVLVLTCVAPERLDGESYPWQLLARAADPFVAAWIVLGSVAGLVALGAGLAGWRSRKRHLTYFLLGSATLALPLFAPQIWGRFPHANPGALPLGTLGSVGWVMLVALVALYAGSGVRVARPTLVLGQAMGALGALLLGVFAFLPMEGQEASFAVARLSVAPAWRERLHQLLLFVLVGAAALFGVLNLVRSRAEVALARLTRLLLTAALLLWIALPFLRAGVRPGAHLPVAWGGLRLVAPLFLALDGCIAFLAISATRSDE